MIPEQNDNANAEPVGFEEPKDPKEYDIADEPLSDEELAKLMQEPPAAGPKAATMYASTPQAETEATPVGPSIKVVSIPTHIFMRAKLNKGHKAISDMQSLLDDGYVPFGVTKGDVGNDVIYLFKG
jgi:hypothetical protein